MPTFEVKDPSGNLYTIDGPEGATQEDAIREVQRQLSQGEIEPDKPKKQEASLYEQLDYSLDKAKGSMAGLRRYLDTLGSFQSPFGVEATAEKDPDRPDYKGARIYDVFRGEFDFRSPLRIHTETERDAIREAQEQFLRDQLKEHHPNVDPDNINPIVEGIAEFAKDVVDPTSLAGFSGVAKVGQGIFKEGAKFLATKEGAKQAGKGFAQAGTFGSTAIAIDQLAERGEIDPETVLMGGALVGAGALTLGVGAGAAGRKIVKSINKRAIDKAERLRQSGVKRVQEYKQLELSTEEAVTRTASDLVHSKGRALGPLSKDLGRRTRQAKRELRQLNRAAKNQDTFKNSFTRGLWVRSGIEVLSKISPRIGGKLARMESSRHRMAQAAKIRLRNQEAMDEFIKLPKQAQARVMLLMDGAPLDEKNLMGVEAGISNLLKDSPVLTHWLNTWRQLRLEYADRIVRAGKDWQITADEEVLRDGLKYLANYYPRLWKSGKARNAHYQRHGYVTQAVNRALGGNNKLFSNDMDPNVINDPISGIDRVNRAIFKTRKAKDPSIADPNNLRRRTISNLTLEEASNDIATPMEAVDKYIDNMEEWIHKRQFFGMSALPEDKVASIGRFILAEAAEGGLTPADEELISQVLQARFISGIVPMTKGARVIKNSVNTILLGNPFTAMIQLADGAIAAAANGGRNTAIAFFRSFVGDTAFDKEDIGIHNIATEIDNYPNLISKVGNRLKIWDPKVQEWYFKRSGFEWADKMSKDIFIDSALRKHMKMVRTISSSKSLSVPKKSLTTEPLRSSVGLEGFLHKWRHHFTPEELREIVLELRKPYKEIQANKNPLLGELLYSELSGAQPIDLSSMPVKWLEMRNGRLMYQLSTFAIKQNEKIRTDVSNLWRAGHKVQAVNKLAQYITALSVITGSTSLARDFVFGRLDPNDDRDVEALWYIIEGPLAAGSFGKVNRYNIDRIRAGDYKTFLLNMIGPIPGVVEGMIRSAVNVARGENVAGNIARWIPGVNAFRAPIEKAFEGDEPEF